MRVGEDFKVGFFDVGGRRIIAAIEPGDDTGMLAEFHNLVVQRSGGDVRSSPCHFSHFSQ